VLIKTAVYRQQLSLKLQWVVTVSV